MSTQSESIMICGMPLSLYRLARKLVTKGTTRSQRMHHKAAMRSTVIEIASDIGDLLLQEVLPYDELSQHPLGVIYTDRTPDHPMFFRQAHKELELWPQALFDADAQEQQEYWKRALSGQTHKEVESLPKILLFDNTQGVRRYWAYWYNPFKNTLVVWLGESL